MAQYAVQPVARVPTPALDDGSSGRRVFYGDITDNRMYSDLLDGLLPSRLFAVDFLAADL